MKVKGVVLIGVGCLLLAGIALAALLVTRSHDTVAGCAKAIGTVDENYQFDDDKIEKACDGLSEAEKDKVADKVFEGPLIGAGDR
jgi:hypothetical protein